MSLPYEVSIYANIVSWLKDVATIILFAFVIRQIWISEITVAVDQA